MSLIDAAISRSRTVIAVLVLVLLAGSVAYMDIAKEAEPDVQIPIIYISLHYEGISPEDAERLLVRPMESQLKGVAGLKEMRASAYQGGANVTLEFEAGFDSVKALQDVRDRVDTAKADLPSGTDEPTVNEVNLSLFPVLAVTLGGDVPERLLLRLARDLRDKIEGLPPVLEARIGGERDEQVEILIDPLVLDSYGLEAAAVLDAVGRSNLLIAAGNLDTGAGSFPIKVPGLYETADDILRQPLKVSGDAVVTVADVAEVRRTFKDRESYAHLNGQPALVLEVSKRSGENIISTIEQVRALVEQERQAWPAAVQVGFSQDKSTGIRIMLSDLTNNVIAAVLLVMIVVVAALGVRSGILVGIAIPGSFLAAILWLFVMGFTINIVVLFSLILAVGMLVDGAIVVTEYADRRMNEGLHRREAYAAASKRMAWPIIASTATTLAAFAPLLFWPGIVGEFMKYLPITLTATLVASLAMALLFVPTIGAFIGKQGPASPERMRALSASESGDVRAIGGGTGVYVRILESALRRPVLIVLMGFAALIGSIVLYANFGRGIEFFPDVEPEQAALNVHARGNLAAAEKLALVSQVERAVLDIQAERGEFKSVYTIAGRPLGQDVAEDVIGVLQLEFVDWDRRRSADAITADILRRTSGLAGILVETRQQEAGPPVGKPVQVQLSSTLPDRLEGETAKVRAFFDGMSGLRDVEDSRPMPGIEWELVVDRAQAARFGADIATIGSSIRLVTNGLKFTDYRPHDGDDQIDIVARFPERYRTLDQLDRLRIHTQMGDVPISNFVERRAAPRSGTLSRVDGQRVMTVMADVQPGVLPDTKVRELQAWLASEANIDPAVTVSFRGEDEEQRAAQQFLSRAFIVALFLMAIILVTQFNSFYSAALILSAVVMSTVGVLLGLLAIQQPFGIVMSGVGVIALAGIVVNNNIVLIDTYDRIRRQTADGMEAILRTGAQRLRPVLLTTITTILGLMPMVLAVNIDFVSRSVSVGAPSAQWWLQLSTAIACGLAFATVLTLIVTPSALMIRENWRSRRARRAAERKARRFRRLAERTASA